MRRPMPQLLVSTREDLVKKLFSRRTHHHFTSLPCRDIAVQCRNLAQDSEDQKVRRGHPLPRRPAMIRKPRTPESSWRIHCSGQNVPLTEAWAIGVFDS